MLYIKTFENYDKRSFLNWLSGKFNQEIGNMLGSGLYGSVFEFGKKSKRVIKLTEKEDLDTYSTINKTINGVVKVYSYGKTEVPKRFLLKRFGNEISNTIETEGSYINLNKDGYIYYIIMERLYPNEELENDIHDIGGIFIEFYEETQENTSGIPSLRLLFKNRDDMQILLKFSDYIQKNYPKESNKHLETLAELIVLFRKIGKNFDWMDIHPGQFAYDNKGEIKAYDLDNSYILTQGEVKNIIRESL